MYRFSTFVRMALLVLAAAGFMPFKANAVPFVIGAESVVTNEPGLGSPASFDVTNIINQSGLSANYVSGVTDFASFVGTTTHTPSAVNAAANVYLSTLANLSNTVVTFDFDLGAAFSLDRLALWGDNDSQAITDFDLFASADETFAALTALGSFSATVTGAPVPAQVFNFAETSTRFVRIQVANHSTGRLQVGEVAFGGVAASDDNPVPEPAALALFGVGLLGLGAMRRRKKAA